MTDKMKQNALDYHRYPTPGKLKISATKALTTQEELGLGVILSKPTFDFIWVIFPISKNNH